MWIWKSPGTAAVSHDFPKVAVRLAAPCCFHQEEAAAYCWQAEMKFGTLGGLKAS